MNVQDRSYGWNTVTIDNENDVITRRRKISIRWPLDVQTARGLRKRKWHVTLTHVELVSLSTQSHECYRLNRSAVWGSNKRLSPKRDTGWGRSDHRPRSFKEVWG